MVRLESPLGEIRSCPVPVRHQVQVKVTCLHCGLVHELYRRIYNPGWRQLMCCKCEVVIYFNVPAADLAKAEAKRILAMSTVSDPALD